MSDLEDRIKRCSACSLYKKGNLRLPVGMVKARAMVVGGEDPLLLGALQRMGFRLSTFWFTTLVKHGYGEPPFAVAACKHWLEEEYRLVEPELIVALGANMMHFFGVKGGIQQNAGFVVDTTWGPVLPVLHPFGLTKQMTDVPKFVTQLHAIQTFLMGGREVPPYVEV